MRSTAAFDFDGTLCINSFPEIGPIGSFQQKHIDELQKELLNSKIVLVDGEAFSWYGTHLAKCGEYFFELVKSLD